jgi:hypothetical protein
MDESDKITARPMRILNIDLNLDFALGISEVFLAFSDKGLSPSLLSDIVETSL